MTVPARAHLFATYRSYSATVSSYHHTLRTPLKQDEKVPLVLCVHVLFVEKITTLLRRCGVWTRFPMRTRTEFQRTADAVWVEHRGLPPRSVDVYPFDATAVVSSETLFCETIAILILTLCYIIVVLSRAAQNSRTA